MSAFVRNRKPTVLLSVALTLILAGHAGAQTGPCKPNLHVLAIGVNNPKYMEPRYWLQAAANDAEAEVHFWAAQQGKLFNLVSAFPALTDEKATSQAILTSLDRLTAEAQPGDTAVIALSGHGGFAGRCEEWAFCAYDRRMSTSLLRPRIASLANKGVRVLLIVDTCQSGGIGIQGDNIIILAACAADEAARDGKDGQDNGIYTKALLEGLSGTADANKDGIITLAELNAYAAMRVEQLSRSQCPTCGCPANIRSNLPLAKVGGPTIATLTSSHSRTGPLHSQK